jgi:hypothetical protein
MKSLAELLIFAIIFLVCLGVITWLVALLKPKVLPPLPEPVPPPKTLLDLSEQELNDARDELQAKLRQVQNAEQLAVLRNRILAIDQRMLELVGLPRTPPPVTTPPTTTPPSSN